jgi:hypothetical protein
MPQEFEGDLAGAVFWGADLNGARFRDVDLTGARVSHAFVVDVEIDALVDALVVNGVDVTAYVNERDPWYRQRAGLRAPDPAAMQAAWTALEEAWADTVAMARGLPDAAAHESVAGEWSFVETVRHLVFAMDKWFTAPVLGEGFDPIGLPNRGSVDFGWPDLRYDLAPSAADALAVRDDRARRFGAYLASVPEADLAGSVDVLENGPHPIRACIWTVFEEAFWHNRYARRDLAALGAIGDQVS